MIHFLEQTIYYVFLVIFVFFGWLHSLIMDGNQTHELPKDDKLMYQFINREGEKLEKKYNMRLSGVGGAGGRGEIREIMLAFDGYDDYPYTEQEARAVIMDCLDELVNAANQDEELRPYLKPYPFKRENIEVSIICHYKSGYLQLFPYIAVVTTANGKIGYFTKESEDFGYKTKKYESFEEADEILRQLSSKTPQE
jgi:hypothetical protein